MTRWTVVTLLLAAAFYALALSREVYDVTSPPALGWHVVLRKAYSVGSFALVAYCLWRALGERERRPRASVLTCVVALAVYSAAIETGQALRGSHEGPIWNIVDVACGALGGAIGALFARRSERRSSPRA